HRAVHHLDLKGVTLRDDLVQLDAREKIARIAAKARRAVMNAEAEERPAVRVRTPREEQAMRRPADDLATAHVTRPDGQPAGPARGLDDRIQVLRPVRAISVHLHKQGCPLGEPNTERIFIRAPDAELALPVEDADPTVAIGQLV